ADLEFVELKERSVFFECGGPWNEFIHFNFLVKCSDGTTNLFFVEAHPNCKREGGIFLCCPLEENDTGNCFGCQKCDVDDLRHPAALNYRGGHRDICAVNADLDDDYECFM
uniref:DUF3615 domain-containing protein n=1 Tax=Oryza brachyantha TaxID=4533 RepID=J3N4P0_ORYBR